MNLFQAILLGIVQGLTEFIPVSSSAHLILAERIMGLGKVMTPEQITAFTAVIQLGTLAAVALEGPGVKGAWKDYAFEIQAERRGTKHREPLSVALRLFVQRAGRSGPPFTWQRTFTDHEEWVSADACWSPDGKRVAWVLVHVLPGTTNGVNFELVLTSLDAPPLDPEALRLPARTAREARRKASQVQRAK
mgnify:CR=1 FL=1